MLVHLAWQLGNTLYVLKAETIGHYARYIVAQEVGFSPTEVEMGLGVMGQGIQKEE
jgi:hypothetical protein